jgi:hypothetical protein
MQGQSNAPGAESATSQTVIVDLSADEREQLRIEADHVCATAEDAIHPSSTWTSAQIEGAIARLQTVRTMLLAAETGTLRCEPDVLAALAGSLNSSRDIVAANAARIAKYDEHGPEGFWDAKLRARLTVEELLHDLAGARSELEHQQRQQELLAGLLARVDQTAASL